MANTFLNTGNVVSATSNPEANIQQVSNTATQPIQNNANGISPITIPIQIQPQIATANTAQTTATNNIQNLQTDTNQVSSVPTPQTYNPSSTNNNVVDFNKIYESYQSAFGNNQNVNTNIGQSGIKKTSIGTTIVTPTTANLNSVQGQYQSAYSDTINSVISSMLTQLETIRNGSFYDPTQDKSLQVASEYASNRTLQSLAGSGVLNSTATAERVARIVSELIPQYEQKAYDRQMAYLGQLADMAQVVMSYDAQQFEYWKDSKDREFKEKEFAYQKQQDALENAWKRVDELGYVDNEASTILGVKVGTLSGTARLAKEEREFELQKMREQAQIEYANQVALYKVKNEIEKEYAKYEYDLIKTYGSKSSSISSNYETYDEIIKNRYAEYDDFTRQYVVPDEKSYNELMNYLDRLYANGMITENEFLNLSAKYSKYSNQSSTEPTETDNNQEKTETEKKNVNWLSGVLSIFGK